MFIEGLRLSRRQTVRERILIADRRTRPLGAAMHAAAFFLARREPDRAFWGVLAPHRGLSRIGPVFRL
jgi:hypothetical protein